MKVIELTPRGYCHGVLNALAVVKKVYNDNTFPRPIYILGEIVHNKNITDSISTMGIISLSDIGVTRLELLDQISTGTVIFTAHGVSNDVIKKATEKGLKYVNATCYDVVKIHKLIAKRITEGYEIIYIGHKNHPETEGILGIDKRISLVETTSDIAKLNIINKNIYVTNQTTLSTYDISDIIVSLKQKYPSLIFNDEICNATKLRQLAVMKQEHVDICLVIGDKKSSNANRLVSVSVKNNIKTFLVNSFEELPLEELKNSDTVSVTSSASTPTLLTESIITYLKQFDKNDSKTWNNYNKNSLTNFL